MILFGRRESYETTEEEDGRRGSKAGTRLRIKTKVAQRERERERIPKERGNGERRENG